MYKTWVIYLVRNMSDAKCYIGYSDNFDYRWKTHCSEATNDSPLYFHRAIKKYKPEAFTYEILASVKTKNEAKALEKLWILALRSYDPEYGYNMTMGGDGISGCIWITDGLVARRWPKDQLIPDGFYKGRLEKQIEKVRAALRAKIWITNGIENKNISATSEIPQGYRRGLSQKGYIWISDGIKIKRLQIGKAIPEGYREGRSEKHRNVIRGKIWITDGRTNKTINPDDTIPEKWKRGRTVTPYKGHACTVVTKQFLSNLTSNTIPITNGMICKRILKTDKIPEGFRKGRLKNKRPAWNKGIRKVA